jgi:hypothetical protein
MAGAPSSHPRRARTPAQEAAALLDDAYWARLCPWLHVGGTLPHAVAPACLTGPGDARRARAHLEHQGFLRVDAAAVTWPDGLIDGLARGVLRLAAAGHPASFILAYDEAWHVQAALAEPIRRASGGNLPLGDWYVFCVNRPDGADEEDEAAAAAAAAAVAGGDDDGGEENEGDDDGGDDDDDDEGDEDAARRAGNGVAAGANKAWPPHRDRPLTDPAAIAASFRVDGTAMYTTVWVPLTDATPERSCLYCVPRPLDPGYHAGDAEPTDPVRGAVTCAGDFQKVLALPAAAGSVVAFSHRLLHWGSTPLDPVPGQPRPPPRLALSLAFSDADFERPYCAALADAGPYPPHGVRLGLVAAQALNYDHQVPLTRRQARVYGALFEAAAAEFDGAYAERVMATAKWSTFKKSLAAGGGLGSLRRSGAPSQDDINLLFCALAGARAGLDAESYL